jgi:hypothetical protein
MNTAASHKQALTERFKFYLAALDAAGDVIYAAANSLYGPCLCSQSYGLEVWVTAPYKASAESVRDIAGAPVYVCEFEGFKINVRYDKNASQSKKAAS